MEFLRTTERETVFSDIGRKITKIVVCAVPPQFPEVVNPGIAYGKYHYLVICDSKETARKEAKRVQEKFPYDQVVILKETTVRIK